MKQDLPKYDVQRKSKVTTRAMLRAVVSGYLLYLSWMIVTGALAEDSSMSGPTGIVIGAVLALAAVLFGIYTWKQYRLGLKEAELTSEELEERQALAEEEEWAEEEWPEEEDDDSET